MKEYVLQSEERKYEKTQYLGGGISITNPGYGCYDALFEPQVVQSSLVKYEIKHGKMCVIGFLDCFVCGVCE